MTQVEEAMRALAERGQWCGQPSGDPEEVRAAIRREGRRRGIRLRTITDAIGRPHAYTLDGLPAEEPWRGAVLHMEELDPHWRMRLTWGEAPRDKPDGVEGDWPEFP